MSDAEELLFVCPECGEHIDVNDAMREALVEHGCVICGADVAVTDFSLSS